MPRKRRTNVGKLRIRFAVVYLSEGSVAADKMIRVELVGDGLLKLVAAADHTGTVCRVDLRRLVETDGRASLEAG